jgi:RHS repeat-associated protein
LGDTYEGSLKYNYLYQGAFSELDDDIGWNDFALRNYNPQIGRWVQMDPYDEFASPYVGMGGDPVNLVDPSGGFVLAGLTKAGSAAILTLGGFILGEAVGLISGDDDFTGGLIGAGIGLGAGLANLSMRIAVNMGIQSVNMAISIVNGGTNSPSVGPDHVWSGNSNNFSMKVQQNGTNSIYVIINNVKKLITDVDLNSEENRQLIANIFGYYADKVGISMYVYGGTGTFGLMANPDGAISEDNPAFTKGMDISINKTGNKINSDLSNINSTTSILEHEKYHQDDFDPIKKTYRKKQTVLRHAEVYLKQIKSPTFKNTPPKFQESMIRSFSNYLMDAKNKNYVGVDDLIKDFNNNNGLGYSISLGDDPSGQCLDCKMYIKKNGKLIETKEYKPIKNED